MVHQIQKLRACLFKQVHLFGGIQYVYDVYRYFICCCFACEVCQMLSWWRAILKQICHNWENHKWNCNSQSFRWKDGPKRHQNTTWQWPDLICTFREPRWCDWEEDGWPDASGANPIGHIGWPNQEIQNAHASTQPNQARSGGLMWYRSRKSNLAIFSHNFPRVQWMATKRLHQAVTDCIIQLWLSSWSQHSQSLCLVGRHPVFLLLGLTGCRGIVISCICLPVCPSVCNTLSTQ